MFERLTAKTRESLKEASLESRTMAHGFIGTEHLLLGLLKVPDSVGATVLATAEVSYGAARDVVVELVRPSIDTDALSTLGIDMHSVREAVEDSFGSGALDAAIAGAGGRRGRGRLSLGTPFTPRAKKVLELALREAINLRVGYISTEHVLLGIVREGEGVAAQVIKRLAPGVDFRALVFDRLRQAS